MKHDRVFQILDRICESQESPAFRKRIAAALVHKNNILSVGVNKTKTHPFQARHSHHPEKLFLHAETDCLSRAIRQMSPRDISRATLYISRIKLDDLGNYSRGIAKPCLGCQKSIASLGISKVCYTTDEGNYEWL